MLWGNLVHLSFNMWAEPGRKVETWGMKARDRWVLTADPVLRFDQSLWNDLVRRMAEVGMNMILIDLGDALRYQSHPEIAVRRAWSARKLKTELARLRDLGLEPLPKLNFSGHDTWLGEYARCLSTPVYYRVCADLIAEVCDLFDGPRFFHLGYDEETFTNQAQYDFAVVRQHELWWHDFDFFVRTVRRNGPRPWFWSDFVWKHPAEFYRRMPKDVLQSNWWYWRGWNARKLAAVRTFADLEQHKFDQVPTGSNWAHRGNFRELVAHCNERVHPARLLGYLQSTWYPTLERYRKVHLSAVDAVGEVIAAAGKV